MNSMLQKENIEIRQKVRNWQHAIDAAVGPLIRGGYVEERYKHEIIRNTFTFGPYYVLAPDIALLHSRPEHGVNRSQLGVLVLREPVKFSKDGFDVRLLVTLATTDDNSHLDALRKLGKMFCDGDVIKKVVEAETIDEIYDQFTM